MREKMDNIIRKKIIEFKQMGYPPKAFEPFIESLKNDILDLIAKDEKEIRKYLWLNHGNDCIPYGDDGEMQCCGFDFKRMDLLEILELMKIKHKIEVEE